MRTSILAAMLLAAAGAFAPAAAQNAPTYPYCLLEGSGSIRGGGGSMLCRYTTLAQCMASRTGNSDTCIQNPWLQRKK